MSKKSVRFNDDVKVYLLPDEDRRPDLRELFAQLRLEAEKSNVALQISEESEEEPGDEDTTESEDSDVEEDDYVGADCNDFEDDDDIEIVFSD